MKDSTKAFITEEVERVISERYAETDQAIKGLLVKGVLIGGTAYVTYRVMNRRANRKARKAAKKNK